MDTCAILVAQVRSVRSITIAAGLLSILFVPFRIEAADQEGRYAQLEIALLPKYCQSRMGANAPADTAYWKSVMGETYEHIHHYCRGLALTNRANLLLRSPRERLGNLRYSISEFDYTLRNATPDFKLLPEIHTKRGQNLLRLGKISEGIEGLQRAISLKTDYWPAYAALSDHFKETGDIARAREWLEKGLSVAPDTTALTRRLAELGTAKSGRKPPPTQEPIEKSAAPEPSAPR